MQLFRELRNAKLSLRAILITSYGSPELREQALTLGFDAYFDKPLALAALLATLDQALREPSHAEPG